MPRLKIVKKPEGVALSLGELCGHDDVCTDIVLDRTHYHTSIRKCRSKYQSLRGLTDTEVVRAIQEMIGGRDTPEKLREKICGVTCVQHYLNKLDTLIERARFQTHLTLYIQPYLPSCPWEISSTNRFDISSYESSVIARAPIPTGTIPYLIGVTVELTETEAANAEQAGHGLSVLVSAKTGAQFVMLGPARLVNHDCSPNAVLRPTETGMEVQALRTINVNEEVVVFYGGEYFGKDNRECLCLTCEHLQRNGWAQGVSDPPEAKLGISYTDACRVPSEYLAIRKALGGRQSPGLHGREPGDYVFTKKLLIHPYDRWVRCGNAVCKRAFVQQDGHLLRLECPRCERHRRLYGFEWPAVRSVAQTEVDVPLSQGKRTSDEVDDPPSEVTREEYTMWVPTAKAKLITRRGLYMEAQLARANGGLVDDDFDGGTWDRRRSKRRRRKVVEEVDEDAQTDN